MHCARNPFWLAPGQMAGDLAVVPAYSNVVGDSCRDKVDCRFCEKDLRYDMKLSRTSKYLIKVVCLVALALIVIGSVAYRSIDALYFAIGVILTSSLNVAKVFLLERTVQRPSKRTT